MNRHLISLLLLDIVQEAGEAQKTLVKEFHGIQADRDVTINFVAKNGSTLISGIEIIADSK